MFTEGSFTKKDEKKLEKEDLNNFFFYLLTLNYSNLYIRFLMSGMVDTMTSAITIGR